MSILKSLQKCSSIHDFAPILGYQPKSLSFILYKIPEEQKYITFSIPKKSGGERIIKAPISRLKLLQKILADRLYACVEEINSKKIDPITDVIKDYQSRLLAANGTQQTGHSSA